MEKTKRILSVILVICMALSFCSVSVFAEETEHEHDYEYEQIILKPATCTVNGVEKLQCSCGAAKYQIIPASHKWDKGEVTKAATCTEKGEKLLTCTECGKTKIKNISITPHSYKEVTKIICKDYPYTINVCEYCGAEDSESKEYVEGSEKVKHEWDDGVVTTEPTEESEGVKTYTCSECGETKTETIPTLEHTHVYTSVVTAPTCTEAGYTTYTCACGDEYVSDEVEALGHKWNDGVVTTEPTAETEGVKTYTCSECGETKTESIEKLDHNCKYTYRYVRINGKLCKLYRCSVCGNEYIQ